MEAVGEEEGTVVADGREEARDVHEEEAFESASSFSKTKMSSAGLLCRLLVSCGGCGCSCGCGPAWHTLQCSRKRTPKSCLCPF